MLAVCVLLPVVASCLLSRSLSLSLPVCSLSHQIDLIKTFISPSAAHKRHQFCGLRLLHMLSIHCAHRLSVEKPQKVSNNKANINFQNACQRRVARQGKTTPKIPQRPKKKKIEGVKKYWIAKMWLKWNRHDLSAYISKSRGEREREREIDWDRDRESGRGSWLDWVEIEFELDKTIHCFDSNKRQLIVNKFKPGISIKFSVFFVVVFVLCFGLEIISSSSVRSIL